LLKTAFHHIFKFLHITGLLMRLSHVWLLLYICGSMKFLLGYLSI
jgi:hypothetical protein